jgi:uncharacterized protein
MRGKKYISMRILITGGSGFVGGIVTRRLRASGHEVTILTRNIAKKSSLLEGIYLMEGDPTKTGSWQKQLANYEVIVNLAGASIFRRWTLEAKKEILNSRILSTQNIVDALAYRATSETHLLSVSGIAYYGSRGEEELDENNSPAGDFLAQVAQKWESTALSAKRLGVRVVVCRLGHVLGLEGGALPKMTTIARLHLGSAWGTGNQWFSWIHQDDLANVFLFLLERKDIEGQLNLTAPNPIRNKEVMMRLCEAVNKRVFIPAVPDKVLRLILGEFSGVFLNSQRVLPSRLRETGFSFTYPTIQDSFNNLFANHC